MPLGQSLKSLQRSPTPLQSPSTPPKRPSNAAHTLARALVTCCTDHGDLTTAAKYDQPLSTWRAMRDEALIQRTRLLEADRSERTASLLKLSRAAAVLFDQIEDLLPQFSTGPLGARFVATYLTSTKIFHRGHTPLPTPPNAPTPPV